MASPVTHFIVGAAMALPVTTRWSAIIVSGLIGVAPDLDLPVTSLFAHGGGEFFGHRGLFHSPFFLAVATALFTRLAAPRDWRTLVVSWVLAAVSHPLLDALTDAEPPVMLLFPFTDARMFFPWRPLHAMSADVARALREAVWTLRSELPFTGVILACAVLLRRRRLKKARARCAPQEWSRRGLQSEPRA